jgi:sterol 24-C-methyltransferase
MTKNNTSVSNYYHSWESIIGYRKLGGIKHFGYYPEGKEHISKHDAQLLMNAELAKNLALPKNSKVLDVGCGEGGVALYLARNYDLQVEGIDLLDFNIARARRATQNQQLDKTVNFRVASYQELPFKDNSFDAVYTVETLVHSPDYHRALLEFYRVLKPGGSLVLFEYSLKPNKQLSEEERRGIEMVKYVNEYASMPAFNEFKWDNMQAIIAAAGFKNETEENITERILPMLRQFAVVARLPYFIAKLLHLEKHVVNAMSAVVFWDYRSLFRYNIIVARK